MENKVEKPTIAQLWQDIKTHRKLYYKVLPATFVAAAIIMLSIPNYYKCTVMLAPELSSMGVKSSGLSSIARTASPSVHHYSPLRYSVRTIVQVLM